MRPWATTTGSLIAAAQVAVVMRLRFAAASPVTTSTVVAG
jgi:hypothetical protein